jgi:hypothetical protein
LAAIGALAACLLDGGERVVCDLAAIVVEASDVARLSGLDVTAALAPSAKVLAAADPLRRAVSALIRVVAGTGGRVVVDLAAAGDRALVRILNAAAGPMPLVVHRLVEAVGGVLEDAPEGGVAFSMELT